MAYGATYKDDTFGGSSASSTVTASVSGTAGNRFLIVWIGAAGSGKTVSSMTGSSIANASQVDYSSGGTYEWPWALWIAEVTGSAGAITISHTSSTNRIAVVIEITGGPSIVRQYDSGWTSYLAPSVYLGNQSCDLAVTPQAQNVCVAVGIHETDTSGVTADSGYTELVDIDVGPVRLFAEALAGATNTAFDPYTAGASAGNMLVAAEAGSDQKGAGFGIHLG